MAVHLLALYHKSVRLVSIISYCLISSDICWLNKINIRLTLHIAWIQSKLIFFVSNSEINVNANKSNECKKKKIIKSPKTNWKIACPFWKKTKTLPVLLLLMVLWITIITNISLKRKITDTKTTLNRINRNIFFLRAAQHIWPIFFDSIFFRVMKYQLNELKMN